MLTEEGIFEFENLKRTDRFDYATIHNEIKKDWMEPFNWELQISGKELNKV